MLKGKTVAVEGLGNVGMDLCRLLHEAGAQLVVTDVDSSKVEEAARKFGARTVPAGAAHAADVDIYAPCALGGVLNARTIPEIKARIVAGAANNQLATPEDGDRLHERGILYCPDYAVNAGGVLSLPATGATYDRRAALDRAVGVAATVAAVLRLAEQRNVSTHQAADMLALTLSRDYRSDAERDWRKRHLRKRLDR